VSGIELLALAAGGAVGALAMRWWQQRARRRARGRGDRGERARRRSS
jgi:hypothetical protein